jgi:hypothetical protein
VVVAPRAAEQVAAIRCNEDDLISFWMALERAWFVFWRVVALAIRSGICNDEIEIIII